MKRIFVALIAVLWILSTGAAAKSILASDVLERIYGEYFYEMDEDVLSLLESISEDYSDEDSVLRIVSLLDNYTRYYTAEYCKNLTESAVPKDFQYFRAEDKVYIRIDTFSKNTGKSFADIWSQVNENDKVYIDLRNCDGGYVDSMLEVAGCLVDEGELFTAQFKNDNIVYSVTDSKRKTKKDNLILLVSQNTKSSAEILAGVVKAKGCGIVAGSENTCGKTSIQRLYVLRNGGILKLTVGKYSVIGLDDFSETGIVPDVEMCTAIKQD